MYEPHLIAPFKSSLVKRFKPWIIGEDAFPDIEDAYVWRGVVKKRIGMDKIASFPASDKPVQGLKVWINPSSLGEFLIGFSQTKSYVFNGLTNTFTDITFLASTAPFSWNSTINQFFWTSNYVGSLWTTNSRSTDDHIRFWNGTNANGWSVHQPIVSGTTTLDGCLIILPYKGRLVCLNTTENGVNFQSRARWSQVGTPYSGNQAAKPITGVTFANPASIHVVGHGFPNGSVVGLTNIQGSTGNVLNQNEYVITVTGVDDFTVPVNTTGLSYTGGTGLAQGPGTTTPPPGSVYGISPFAWRDDIVGRGGYVDADTSEQIVSADIVKDTLIVGFQRSTWRLRFTGNDILPFQWERLNTQFGAESTFSNVAFDEDVLFFSRYGWIGVDTNNAHRIDEAIPDDSFAIESVDGTLSGMSHVQGIRDYYRQFAYWTYQSPGSLVPNKMYAYNYLDKTWQIFNPIPVVNEVVNNIRVLGAFKQNADVTWQSLNQPIDDTWENTDATWGSLGPGGNANFPWIVGGDFNGNVYQMFEFIGGPTSDNGNNFPFTVLTKRFNPYIDEGHKCRLGYIDLYLSTELGGEITLQHFVDDQNTPILTRTVQLYSRGPIVISAIATGLVTTITTSSVHSLQTGQLATITSATGTIDVAINNMELPVTVIDTFNFTIAINTTSLTYIGNGVVWSDVQIQGDSKYTRVYLGAIAHMHQISLTLNSSQVADPLKGAASFELQGMVLWTKKVGRIRG